MQGFSSDRLRNIVLLSHSGAGKTSLAEAMLYATGAVTRQGRVEDGNTTSDYEPEEVKRQSSIQTALVPCIWQNTKLNILDTPGYADFFGEVVSGLRVADAAVIVVDAISGVEVGTELVWRLLEERQLPRLMFINKMDRDNADFSRCLEAIQGRLGGKCIALQLPVGAQANFKEVVGLLQPPQEPPADLAGQLDTLRDRLMEAVAETDDDLTTKYLEEESLSQEELTQGLKLGVRSGAIVPVVMGSATQGVGITELLDALVSYLPSPKEIPAVQPTTPDGAGTVELPPDESGPPAALVFKTAADPFVGKLSYFRVYSGAMKSNAEVWNAAKRQAERIVQLFVPRGKSQEQVEMLPAGDIGAVAKLTATTTGDTLCQRDQPVQLPGLSFPNPTYAVAVLPKNVADLDKMSTSLARMAEEDPSLRVYRDPDTGESLVAGLGDVHLETVLEKIKRKFGLELNSQTPKVAYRETITVSTKVEYKHKKQSGGHGQYGHVFLELEPRDRSAGFEFARRVVGGNVPREYIPSVEKGVVKTLQEGVVAGYPVVDLKVVLYDGSSHPVDSSGMSFEIAGAMAVREGVRRAQPSLLEPIMAVQVTVPDAFTGEVIGDLNSKRARILGMTPQDGVTVVQATVPQAEMLHYATELRSITQGRGTFTMEPEHYEPVPQHLAQRIIDETNKAREEARG